MGQPRIPRVPDDWAVWAFTDSHGVTSALVAGLQEAGLLDRAQRWIAPPRTALIGCGDYVDGGMDSAGMVALLQRLQVEALASGSLVLPARGNHEAMMLSIRAGRHDVLGTWLKYGGPATLESFGCPALAADEATRFVEVIDAHAPGLFDWLDGLPQAVRWRDVIFVHGGLPLGHSVDDFGLATDEHLWVRAAFVEAAWDSAELADYRRDGIDRVVFGHTPQPAGATLFHDGRSFNIDSNAVGNPRLPVDNRRELTLLGLQDEVTFRDAQLIVIPTAGAADAWGAN